MKPYKGIIRITCKPGTCGQAGKLKEPAAECINCEAAKVEVLDLEGKATAGLARPKPKAAPRARKL